ncbi:hypothetical protein D3C71_2091500 [compost metagenome]
MGNAAVALVGQEEHLRLPAVATQWPAMAEDDRLAGAPVLVVDLGTVAGGDSTHAAFSWVSWKSDKKRETGRG